MRTLSTFASVAALLTLAACAPPPSPQGAPDAMPPGPAPVEPAPPATQPAPPAGGEVAIVGTWKSPACGTRKYERNITFAADNTFTAKDLVSPCPPNVACIWSGIVDRSGAYTLAGAAITFTRIEPSQARGEAFPTALTIDPATKAPAERAADGSVCVYQR